MLEEAVEQGLHRKVRQRGGETYKICPEYCAGIPDRLVLLPGGRVYLVELKSETGTLRPDQVIWHEKAAAVGVTVVVLSGTKEVNAWLDEVLPINLI